MVPRFHALDLTGSDALGFLQGLVADARAPWPERPVVVYVFLVHDAIARIRPLLRALWEEGGVTLVTTGTYHLRDWACDRGDLAFGLRVMDPIAGTSRQDVVGARGKAAAASAGMMSPSSE